VIVGSKGKQAEFDMVLVNGNSVALLEVKHKAHLSALDQLEKQIKRYRELFPEHASYKLYGGIAGLSVPEDTVHEAHKRGLFVLKQQGDVFAVDAEAMRAF
jgi:RecB family endonuclease NucS